MCSSSHCMLVPWTPSERRLKVPGYESSVKSSSFPRGNRAPFEGSFRRTNKKPQRGDATLHFGGELVPTPSLPFGHEMLGPVCFIFYFCLFLSYFLNLVYAAPSRRRPSPYRGPALFAQRSASPALLLPLSIS